MTLHLHHVHGCSPAPLANYLKALGILRLVSEQADAQARGWWQDEHFCLLTKLSKKDLEAFFLTDYEPTPIFNPWGGRSGYYDEASETTSRIALIEIESSDSAQLVPFRSAIQIIRQAIADSNSRKPNDELERLSLIRKIKCGLRNSGQEWLATVLADLGDHFRGPSILGTGGNEGSGSYTASFLAAVVECIIRKAWNSALEQTFSEQAANHANSWDGTYSFGKPNKKGIQSKKQVKGPFRQFLPEGSQSPWDLLFAFEGTIAVQSGIVRRLNPESNRFLSSPFFFETIGSGAASSSEMDEFVLNKGRKNPGRGEQWFPLWSNPTTYNELKGLFRDARCSNGCQSARTAIDAARAIRGLGIARGVDSFLRYGYLQRDNLATHFAVPLGRVSTSASTGVRLFDDLSNWFDRLHYLTRKQNAPQRLTLGFQRFGDSAFAALTHDDSPERWQEILRCAVAIETMQATGTAVDAGPIPPLNPQWINAIGFERSPEVRLAVALGSSAAAYSKDQLAFDPVRHHCLPMNRGARQFKTKDKRLVNDPRVVVSGRDPLADCAAIVQRRLIEAAMKGERRLRLVAPFGCGARLSDLALLLAGHVNLQQTFELARALMAVKWDKFDFKQLAYSPRTAKIEIPEAWLAIRLACLPCALPNGQTIPAETSMIARLMSGDGSAATQTAIQRLRAAGIRPPLQAAITDQATARLWAAALAFPIDRRAVSSCLSTLDPNQKEKQNVRS